MTDKNKQGRMKKLGQLILRDSTQEPSIGSPANFKVKSHIDANNWKWEGAEGEEGYTQFEAGVDLGQGYLIR